MGHKTRQQVKADFCHPACCYAQMLEAIQESLPEFITVALGNGNELQPSDKEIQAASKDLPVEEYRLGYILVAEKTLAEKIIAELDNKKDFASLAKKTFAG